MAAANTLSTDFNNSAVWSAIKFAFEAIVIGILVGGLIDFTFFHNHPAGKALIEAVNEPLQNFYDGLVSFLGFPEYARDIAQMQNMCPDPISGLMGPC